MRSSLIFALAFCSGFSVMAIELLAGRTLAPYFGASIHVWGSVITVFMLSLSLGYLAGGRWSLKSPNLRRFSLLFFASALSLLPLLIWSEPMMDRLSYVIEDPRYGSLLAAFCLYFLPTAFMGTISPYSVRLLVERETHSGHIAGRLYFVSTLGSALGTLLTSFYLVLYFEVNTLIAGLGVLLFLCGCLTQVAYRSRSE